MDELEKLREKIKRLQKVIELNQKNLRKLRPILNNMAKQIGYNSSDIKKIIQTLYENFDIEGGEKEPPEMNADARGTFI